MGSNSPESAAKGDPKKVVQIKSNLRNSIKKAYSHSSPAVASSIEEAAMAWDDVFQFYDLF